MIQIDHFVIFDIIKQNSIVFITSIMRINVKFVKNFQFFRQFNLKIRYKSEKKHIILNALFRLTNVN